MITLLMSLTLLASNAKPTPTPTPSPEATPAPAINVLLRKTGGSGVPRGQDLSEVAKKIKLRLPADQPRRLTNDSIKVLSEGVELTQTKARPAGSSTGVEESSSGVAQSDDDKQRFWVELYQAARGYVLGLEQLVPQLDGEVNRLRTAFYSTDDFGTRDGVIKPAWDKALADWQQAKADLEEARSLPGQVLDAARHDDALPGWFRGLPEPGPTLNKPRLPGSPPRRGSPPRDDG